MKKHLCISATLALSVFLLLNNSIYGQTTVDYFLLPGDSLTLPEGSSQQLNIWWADNNGGIHEGISTFGESLPTWYLNGKERGKADPKDGKLSVTLALEHATYTAPQSLPPQNPVVISVSFRANDSTKEMTTLLCRVRVVAPKKKWYVSYTITSYKYSSNKNSSETDFDESHASGNGSMVVDAPPPDASGYVIFDAPAQNKLEYGSVSGSMTENSSYISRDAFGKIDEKTIRHASGQADHQYDGVEFEYDPKNGGMLNAGISFNENHIAKFWKLDYNSNSNSLKLVDTDTSSQNDETTIGVGGSGATLKKTKTGFTIDYSAAKDTSYTDMLGTKHVERSGLTSHATINYIR